MATIKLERINLNLLLTLDALLQTADLKLASELLLVTRSSVSHSLRQLREHLGDPILVRSATGSQLTPFAQALREPLRLQLQQLERVLNGEREFDPAKSSRRFSFISMDAFHFHLYPAILACMQDLGSPMTLRQVAINPDSLEAALAGVHDFYLGARQHLPAELDSRYLLRFDFVAVASRGLFERYTPEARVRGSLTLAEYVALPHARIVNPAIGPSLIERRLEEQGMSRRIVVEVEGFAPLALLLAEGCAVFAAPRAIVGPLLGRAPTLVSLELPPELSGEMRLSLVWHTVKDQDPGHRWMRELVLAQARALWPGPVTRETSTP